MSTRIDIAINEAGSSVALRQLEQLADATQKLSPATARSLKGEALRLGLNIDKMVQDVAVAALDTVVHATPHDTGQARANWQVAVRASRPINTPLIGHLDYDGDATVAKGTALIRAAKRNPGQTIYISNSLDYIQALNEGHSTQARPAGFVERAVQAASLVAANAKVL